MAKRNARKQATREDVEGADVVCRELAALLDRAELLVLTAGSDYDGDEGNAVAVEYEKRLNYLPILLDELVTHRVDVLIAEAVSVVRGDGRPPVSETPAATNTEEEGSPDGDASETE